MAMKVPDIHAAEKTAQWIGSWTEGDNHTLALVVALEIEDVAVEGLVLRGSAYKDRPDEAVMFQLECVHDPVRRDRAIDRIDWRPLKSHVNGGTGPQHLRYKILRGTHHHTFDLNWLTDEERMRKLNLPLADEVNPDWETYEELVDFVKKFFRITDLEFPVPPWEAKLL